MKTVVFLALLMPVVANARAPAPGANPNAVSCRMTSETGSRLTRNRTCRTQAEWDQQRREQRSTIDRAQTRQVNRTVDEVGRTH